MILIGIALVLCLLLGGGLAEWYQYTGGFGGRLFVPDSVQGIAPVCCIVGAMGVIWLGWHLLKLAGAITSIAGRLKIKRPDCAITSGNEIAEQLSSTIDKVLDSDTNYINSLEKQIKDLQVQVQLSQRQRRNTKAIIYSIRDAVIVIDEFDRLLMANEAAGKLFNFDFKNSQYKAIDQLIDPAVDNKGQFVSFLRQSRENKVPAAKREITFAEKTKARTYDCTVSCVYDQKEEENTPQNSTNSENKQVCGLVTVLHDVTREKEISQSKNDFVSHVSHELKTPLASINAYSEMLLDGEAKDDQTRKQFYSVIKNQAERLNRLIEDILNISRIESGLIKVEKKPVSLTILIEEQMQMIKGYADEKSIRIIRQKPIVRDQVYVDRDMISQVIINLLSNAVKYTSSGGSVTIQTEVDDTASLISVSITDTGVGISKDKLEHIFDRFYRVDENKSCAKGTGLGLNLVKQIVEKVHNGRVFVHSKPGAGSTFGFELPLATKEAISVPAKPKSKKNLVEAK
jgi:two-component system phosphate regulon sensor histidine kinase PhoR